MKRRVVVTGMAGITSLGDNWEEIRSNMLAGITGVKTFPEWDKIKGLQTRLGAPIENFTLPEHYTRKKTRSMGRVALLANVATETALQQAGLLEHEDLTNGKAGIAYGSCSGSMDDTADLVAIRTHNTTEKISATTYIKLMSHTCAVNTAMFFGITGRIIPTASACTSGSQAIGYAYEAINSGNQDIMIAGGAEEFCVSEVAVFDTLYATSQRNNEPQLTPRPFDKDRDGLVIGEGSCSLILEELEHAQNRGAKIYAEVVGFGTNCDATHITHPNAKTMQRALELALKDAALNPKQIGYVCAHGTATTYGDIAESKATHKVFGSNMPISSLKSYFGHTLGACGALEAWLSINMMHENSFIPTINLDNVDPNCAQLDYIKDQNRHIECEYIMSNNFAFGGINTSLIFRKSI